MLNLEPTMEINHTTIEQWYIRPAVSFWAKAYAAGVRILWDGQQFQYQQACNWYCRLETHGAFGLFPASVPVVPEPWVTDGVEQHDAGMIVFLSQTFPEQYRRFAAHMLVLDYEVKPIEANARRNGHWVVGTGVNGGQVLMYHGKCKPSERTPVYSLPPVLSHYKEIVL